MIKTLSFFIALFVLVRFPLFFLIEYISLGGGSDANYYHSYAIGVSDFATSTWPIFLRWLNDVGFYDRGLIVFVFTVVSITFMPFLYSRLVAGYSSIDKFKNVAFLIVLAYPTIIIYSTDIYRDIAMYLIFIVAALSLKNYYAGSMVYLFVFSLSTFLLLGLRPYLGAAVALAFFAAYVYRMLRPRPAFMLIIYLISLIALKESGLLNPLFSYRGEDGFVDGGSTLGIGLLNSNIFSFTYLFIYSFFAQVFGLFFFGISTLIAFITESLLFIYAFIFVVKNIKYADKVCSFLICFFIIYTSVWVLGNDNVGTAVRLRVPSYLAIIACWLIIKQRKQMLATQQPGSTK